MIGVGMDENWGGRSWLCRGRGRRCLVGAPRRRVNHPATNVSEEDKLREVRDKLPVVVHYP